MIVLGIDPGIDGAMALVDTERASIVAAADLPVVRFDSKTRACVDPRAVSAWLEEVGELPEHIVIEHQQPFGQEGRSTGFVLGVMFGSCTSVAYGLGVALSFVVPAGWKRSAGLLGKDKAAVLDEARRVFGVSPWLEIRRTVVNQVQAIARADAALIAWHGLPRQMAASKGSIKASKPLVSRKKARPTPLLDGLV